MRKYRGKRTLGSALRKAKKLLGISAQKREKPSFKEEVSKSRRKRKSKERPKGQTLLLWVISFPVLLPAVILWSLLLSNEKSVSRAAAGDYEYEETMRGNAMGSAFLMLLFLFVWSFTLPQGVLMWLACELLHWTITMAFWACLLPSIFLGIMYISIASKLLLDNNK